MIGERLALPMVRHNPLTNESKGAAQSYSCFSPAGIARAVTNVRAQANIVCDPSTSQRGVILSDPGADPAEISRNFIPERQCQIIASISPLYPEWLGDRGFLAAHHVRFPYIAGEMAHAISGVRLVTTMARAGMLAFFGAAGLAPDRIENGIRQIQAETGNSANWGANLIHSPDRPESEQSVADTYLRLGVHRVSASAYMRLTPAVVRYACSGLGTDPSGKIRRTNHLFAKVSRVEVARQFLSPAPGEILSSLLQTGTLTREEAGLGAKIPLAEDITVEADSGGHTDNRPLTVLLPAIMALRDSMVSRFNYGSPVRVGAAGGLGTPAALTAAFALGAAYVLTGSINQASVEAEISPEAKRLLAECDHTETAMAPSADMFEIGAKVQVLKRGLLFPSRANLLYEQYQKYSSLEELPPDVRLRLEKDIFHMSIEDVWNRTAEFFRKNDPATLEDANRKPRLRMALTFRWYLGRSSHWAIEGDTSRQSDYQIWCGPAMGAFNSWVEGSFLSPPENRSVAQIARNLLEGAAVITRAQQFRSLGVPVAETAFRFHSRRLE